MARDFDSAASEYFINTSAVLTAAPITMACWGNPDAVTAAMTLMSLGTSGATQNQFRMAVRGDLANDPLEALVGNTGGTFASGLANGCTAATWQHFAAVFASSTSRTPYRNGTAGTNDTTNITPSSIDRTTIGARSANSGVGVFMNGFIAEAGIWNVALTAAEITSLAAGYSPMHIRPMSLVAYWPLIQASGNEPSWAGAFPMTDTNTVGAGAHPNRIIYPARRRIILPAAAAAAALAPPLVGSGRLLRGLVGGRLAA